MSYASDRDRLRTVVRPPDLSPLRVAALLAALVVIASFFTAIYFVVDVISDPTVLLYVAVAAFLAATLLSRVLSVRSAAMVAAGVLALGMAWYLLELPSRNTFAIGAHIEYIVALLSGHSILSIVNLEDWVLAITPAPIFLTWFLALRRRYAASALIGGVTVGFFVLTGDATFSVALVGSVGTLALLGLGTLDDAGASVADAEVVSIVLAAVVLFSLTVSVVPAGGAYSYSPDTGFVSSVSYEDGNSLEANLLSADDELNIQGSISLSPKVRWIVESDTAAYWRVATYDVYTGDGWVRRAQARSDRSSLGRPPTVSRTVTQTFTAESRINTMPAAWRPTQVSGPVASDALVTDYGGLQPARPLEEGDSYSVVSKLAAPSAQQLQNAGTDYPGRVTNNFLQLPDSTPDRIEQRTNILTQRAETPYETALIVERWLENNREYSLDVEKPSGNVADKFLFEMDRGYCVYYATTMAVMLRTQGIPARMVVGYTPGERIAEDQWAVRGLNSHAWVEAYFPDVGWVRFDPTPAGPRDTVEGEEVAEARENNVSDVDTEESANSTFEPPTFNRSDDTRPVLAQGIGGRDTFGNTSNDSSENDQGGPSNVSGGEGSSGDNSAGGIGSTLPSREQLLLGLVAVLGLVASARRTGASGRLYREVWLRWQPRADPVTDVERAYQRLEHVLERDHRERRPGETVRQYLSAIGADEQAREVGRLYERARYAGTVDEDAADRAVELVDELVTSR